MTTKHTPGPWFCTKAKHGIDAGHYAIAVIGEDRGDRALIIHAETGDDRQAEENARLFLAARALLAALEKRAQVDAAYAQLAMSDVERDDHERLLQQIEQAEEAAKAAGRAAIAKAKGEQA